MTYHLFSIPFDHPSPVLNLPPPLLQSSRPSGHFLNLISYLEADKGFKVLIHRTEDVRSVLIFRSGSRLYNPPLPSQTVFASESRWVNP